MDNIRRLRTPAAKLTSPGRRFRANWPAQLRLEAARLPCRILDISVGGAKLDVTQLPLTMERLWLLVDFLEPIAAEPVWRQTGLLGVRFLHYHAGVLRLLNQRFDPAAWLSTAPPVKTDESGLTK